eukprot:SAG11_NODE_4107_length_2062_cov_3.650535_1_plen_113_part_00
MTGCLSGGSQTLRRIWQRSAWHSGNGGRRGKTNEKVTEYYKDALFGDSPEMMPLDSSLFNDLIEAIGKNVCATVGLPEGERHTMATPDAAWDTICEAWKIEGGVSSRRIIHV